MEGKEGKIKESKEFKEIGKEREEREERETGRRTDGAPPGQIRIARSGSYLIIIFFDLPPFFSMYMPHAVGRTNRGYPQLCITPLASE